MLKGTDQADNSQPNFSSTTSGTTVHYVCPDTIQEICSALYEAFLPKILPKSHLLPKSKTG